MEHVVSAPRPIASEIEGDELDLVRAAQADPRAFGTLYLRYVDRVYAYLRARVQSAEDASDLTQQVFLQALEALPAYRARGIPFAAWLFRIARNILSNSHRRRRVWVPWDRVPETSHWSRRDAQNPEEQAVRQDDLARLQDRLAALDPGKRELLELRFAGGLTAREIAAVVGKSEAAVKKQLVRTLHSLKENDDDTSVPVRRDVP